jgi:putative component of membrane protein insertase Oxa1/YidC/SpoIIIJ protein YidD
VVDGQEQILFAFVVAACYYSQVCNCVRAAISARAPAFQSVQAYHFFQQAEALKLLVTLSAAVFHFLPACSSAAVRAAFFHSAQALLLVEVRAANCHPAHFY